MSKVTIEGVPITELAKKHKLTYGFLHKRFTANPNITIEEAINPSGSDNAKKFKEEYGMNFKEYAELHNVKATTVRANYLKGNHPLKRERPMIIAGKTVKEWSEISGFSYKQIRVAYKMFGEEMKLEDLQPSDYRSAGTSKRKKPDVISLQLNMERKSNEKKRQRVLQALERERQRVFG